MHRIDEVMTLGTVLAIRFEDEQGGYGSHSAQMLLQSIKESVHNDSLVSSAPGGAPFGINYRTLGNVAYFMTSLNTPSATIRSVEDRIWTTLGESTT
jgi:dethiobiotin synthetase/adenosylmethionine--8-amino-7-oxononanoate aminotransferase